MSTPLYDALTQFAAQNPLRMAMPGHKGKPIPGLYVVGNDGAMLWANEYTIIIPGGTNGHNVNSGRVAAQDAVGLLG